MRHENIDSLINDIYESATNPKYLNCFAQNLLEVIGGRGLVISHNDFNRTQYSLVTQIGVDDDDANRYARDVFAIDDVVKLYAQLSEGNTNQMSQYCGDRQLKSLSGYEEWYKPLDMHQFLSTIIKNNPRKFSFLSVVRTEKESRFSERDMELLRILNPHIVRAVALRERLLVAESNSAAALSAIDQLNCACAFVDSRGRVMLSNDKLEQLAQAQHILIKQRRLQLARYNDNKCLVNAIEECSKQGLGMQGEGISFRFYSKTGRSLVMHCIPYRLTASQMDVYTNDINVAIFISDLDDKLEPSPRRFKQLWGLTNAEIRVLQCFIKGYSTNDSAELLSVSNETVRYHIKNIFRKTGVNRQSELISLVLKSLGQINFSSLKIEK